jgi:RNA polymerase sigma-70 factor (ECF subfamily)
VRDPLEHPEEAIRRVYAYVAYRIGAGPDAEDVTSATIERAIRYRNSYRRDHGSPGAWLIGIARRCLADAMAARAEEVPLSSDKELDTRDHANDAVERVDLLRAVAQLDARSRDLVALRYGADLSSKDIGRLYEMSPGAVDVALHRALTHLRGRLNPVDAEGPGVSSEHLPT